MVSRLRKTSGFTSTFAKSRKAGNRDLADFAAHVIAIEHVGCRGVLAGSPCRARRGTLTVRVVGGEALADLFCLRPQHSRATALLRMKLRWACPVWLLAWRPAVFVCKGNDDQVQTVSSNAFSACSTAMAKCCTAHLFIGFQEMFSTVCCARLLSGNVGWRGRRPGGLIPLDCLMTGGPHPAGGGFGCSRIV